MSGITSYQYVRDSAEDAWNWFVENISVAQSPVDPFNTITPSLCSALLAVVVVVTYLYRKQRAAHRQMLPQTMQQTASCPKPTIIAVVANGHVYTLYVSSTSNRSAPYYEVYEVQEGENTDRIPLDRAQPAHQLLWHQYLATIEDA